MVAPLQRLGAGAFGLRLLALAVPALTVPGMPTCEYPLNFKRRLTDAATGVVREDTVRRRCGTRLASECPSCSELYRGDALAVLRSGLTDAKGLYTFVTLTAPGAGVFGAVHQRVEVTRKDGTTAVRRCPCRSYHDDPEHWAIGTPVDPESYDYSGAARWNAAASRLLAVAMQKLGRILGRKLEWVRVMEPQRRGLAHFHLLVRGIITDGALALAVRGGTNPRTGRRIAPAIHDGQSFGPQCDAQRILPGGKFGVGAYLVKVLGYAVKSTGDAIGTATQHGRKMEAAGAGSAECDHARPDCCDGRTHATAQHFEAGPETVEVVETRTPYAERKRKARPCRRHRSARRGWGYRGHVFSKSRAWGDTFAVVRSRRCTWKADADGSDESALIVEWELLGRGFGPQGLTLTAFAAMAERRRE